jgi:hypothetical protein
MCRLVALLILGCVLVLGGSTAGLAQEATPTASDVVLPPDEPAYGATLGEWLARQTQWMLSLPAAVNPATDETGELCGYGQLGPVFFLATVMGASPQAIRTCTIPTGVGVLLPLFGTECSTVEPPPYVGSSEAELLACAAAEVAAFNPEATMMVGLDGVDVPDLGQYRVQTLPSR